MDKKTQHSGSSRPNNSGAPRPQGSSAPRPQSAAGSRPSTSSRPGGFPGSRPAGAQGSRPGGFSGPRPANGPRPQQAQGPRMPRKEEPYAINDRIRAKEVRIVGDNVENGIYTIQQAIKLADEMELDLIEISPTAQPPVCKILDYSKFLYQQKKRQKEQKAKAAKVVVKEIRFGPQTDEHDYNFKLKHAQSFLQEGSKVKAYVFFKGRSILFKEQGEVLLLRFANDLEELGKVEQMPVLEGKRMIIMLSPKKK
jgi:translation initiation factor IF-3